MNSGICLPSAHSEETARDGETVLIVRAGADKYPDYPECSGNLGAERILRCFTPNFPSSLVPQYGKFHKHARASAFTAIFMAEGPCGNQDVIKRYGAVIDNKLGGEPKHRAASSSVFHQGGLTRH